MLVGVGRQLHGLGSIFIARERRQEDELNEKLSLSRVTRANVITLASARGGCGKTTSSVAIGDVLADTARLRACVLDCDPEFSALRDAVEPRGATALGLPGSVEQWQECDFESAAALAPYVNVRRSGLHVWAPLGHTKRSEDDVYGLALTKLAEHYDVVIVNLGAGVNLDHPVVRTVLETSDHVVITTIMLPATAASTVRTIRYVQEHIDVSILMAITRSQSRGEQRRRVETEIGEADVLCEWIPTEERLGMMIGAEATRLEEMPRSTRLPYKRLSLRLREGFA